VKVALCIAIARYTMTAFTLDVVSIHVDNMITLQTLF